MWEYGKKLKIFLFLMILFVVIIICFFKVVVVWFMEYYGWWIYISCGEKIFGVYRCGDGV